MAAATDVMFFVEIFTMTADLCGAGEKQLLKSLVFELYIKLRTNL